MPSKTCVNRCLVFLLLSWTVQAQTALTIYNQNFGVIREIIPLSLNSGTNRVTHSGVTAYVEPESVTLRDPSGRVALRVLEQNYRADPISMDALLSAYEGKTIEFAVRAGDKMEIVRGRIVRAASAPAVAPRNMYIPYGAALPTDAAYSQSIVETEGKLRFGLPGTPMFPALSPDAILEPTLDWMIHSVTAAKLNAELSYISAGMNWEADYNITQALDGTIDLAGWVTIENRTGRRFENARIKLMAGDVNKVVRPDLRAGMAGGVIGGMVGGVPGGIPSSITEKTFDEYHMYSLPAPATLLDKQTKQVEFIRAAGVKSAIVYVYECAGRPAWDRG